MMKQTLIQSAAESARFQLTKYNSKHRILTKYEAKEEIILEI
jgi:hypothetical protein